LNQLAFGAMPGGGPGDACGRCFALTGTSDPYSLAFQGPFKSIVVKVTNLWCVTTPKYQNTMEINLKFF
jgi:hypothetical protein